MTDPWDVANEASIAAFEPPADEAPPDIVGIEQITPRAFRNGDMFYVRSATARGKFYEVRHGQCGCEGYYYKRVCNHVTHLEKEGYLVHDVQNGVGHQVVEQPANHVERAARVTTGIRHSLAGGGEELEQRDAQIRRLQAFARSQQLVVIEQRRLITALRTDSMATGRAMKMVTVVSTMMDEAAARLEKGDLVELSE